MPGTDSASEWGDELAKIREHWEDQARKHHTDMAAVMPDSLLKSLELQAIRDALDPDIETLEAGCGNGVNLLPLSESFRAKLTGFDYAENMIAAAREACSGRGEGAPDFHVADVLGDLSNLGEYAQIFTMRCIINLPSIDLQLEAVKNLASILKPAGRLALLECTQQGLANLNEMRRCVDLPPIENHWHNLYLDEAEFLERVPAPLRMADTICFSSLYYLISRVFNAKLTPPGESPDYLAEINKIATRLPSVGDFGPHKLFVFEKAE